MNAKSPHWTQCHESKAPRADRACKIVFFYEDFDAVIHARKAFPFIVRTLSPVQAVDASAWSFTMLGTSEFNASAILDASYADVLVVAAKGDSELPACIFTWLEMAMAMRGDAEAVLVALHDERLEFDGAAAPLCSSLRGIADRLGVGFVCSRDLNADADQEPPLQAPHDRRGASILVPEATIQPTADLQRWWGIND